MTTIDQLNSTSSFDVNDMVILFSAANGDTRKASLGNLIAFIQQQPIITDTNVSAPIIYSATGIGGSTNSLVVTTNGMAPLSTTPQLISILAPNTNTGPMDITFDGGTDVPINSPSSAPNPVLQAGDWRGTVTYLLSVTSLAATIIGSNASW